ncbi:DUF1049 domain-containing protein [Maritimibacter sp. 55A14]|uniref:LapA family protein n=1 Tax=Maritimibacter sp. 55A14 TaxID=2174844 RepID=UPI000D61D297|nr:LapA family protein [Maritimibacter sp. 55A14]PWE31349.1 DUF1049 domain-containing protein [Maritimibacter sp. 55A14]
MRYIRLVFLAILGILLLTLALANRGPVTLHMLPESIAGFVPLPNAISLPVFVVIFAGIVLGLLIGFVWEWLREHRHRAEAARQRREAAKLKQEVSSLREKKADGRDDVLALLE